MENERNLENEYEAGLSGSVQEYQRTLKAYREGVEKLSRELRRTTLVELVKNPEKLQAYEEIIIDTIEKVENLGRSPPGWAFKKTEVIQNLGNAQEELAQAQYYFLMYKDSNPQASAESIKRIRPCREYLDLAASLMVMVQRGRRT